MEYLCVVEYFFGATPGGSGRVAWDVATALRDHGYSVTMLCYQSPGGEVGISEQDGIRLVMFKKDNKPPWHPRRLQAILDSTTKACKRWLGDREWDLVHVHSPLMGLGVLAALGKTPKYIYTVHSPVVLEQEIIWRTQGLIGMLKLLFGRRALAAAEYRMLQAASAVHTLSQFTRRKLDEAYGVGERITVIPHWYEKRMAAVGQQAARKVLGWPSDATIFFTVRGLRTRYGVDIAIGAIAPLTKGRNCYFYIGGRGPLRKSLEELVSHLHAEEKIRFLGRLSDADLEMAYSAADMFILPTRALECFGLITVEALSFGCPVIATDAGAIPEVMQPILPDCLVPAGNTQALHNKIHQFLTRQLPIPDKDVLIAHAQARYSKGIVVSHLIKLFEG